MNWSMRQHPYYWKTSCYCSPKGFIFVKIVYIRFYTLVYYKTSQELFEQHFFLIKKTLIKLKFGDLPSICLRIFWRIQQTQRSLRDVSFYALPCRSVRKKRTLSCAPWALRQLQHAASFLWQLLGVTVAGDFAVDAKSTDGVANGGCSAADDASAEHLPVPGGAAVERGELPLDAVALGGICGQLRSAVASALPGAFVRPPGAAADVGLLLVQLEILTAEKEEIIQKVLVTE